MFVFIFATAGLLVWAAIKPWVSRWFEVGVIMLSWTGATLILTHMAERRGEVMERAHSERSSVLDVLPDWLYLSTMR